LFLEEEEEGDRRRCFHSFNTSSTAVSQSFDRLVDCIHRIDSADPVDVLLVAVVAGDDDDDTASGGIFGST
jgi:hypothetical protein